MVVTGASINAMEYNTFTRLDPIALGILIALFQERATSIRPLAALGVDPGRYCRIRLCLRHERTGKQRNGEHLASCRSAYTDCVCQPSAVLLGVLGSPHSFFKQRALIYLGKISYGLYVIHELAHLLAKQIFPAASPLRVVGQSGISLAITIALAAASYRWLETPFLRLKEKFAHVQSRPV